MIATDPARTPASGIKLLVKAVNSPTGPRLLLTDTDGAVIGGQVEVSYRNAVDDFPRVTVTFLVDGESVALAVEAPAA